MTRLTISSRHHHHRAMGNAIYNYFSHSFSTRSESKSKIQHSALHSTTRRRRTRSESKSIVQHSALHSTTTRTRSESKSIIQHSALHSATRRRITRSESKSIIQHSALHSTTTRRTRTRSESKSIIQHSALHATTRRRTRSESKSIVQHSVVVVTMEDILLSTVTDSSPCPSFLELFSLHNLSEAPSLTLRHLVSLLGNKSPSFRKYSSSCYHILNIIQLLLHIKVFMKTGSSIEENLYGLVQVTTTTTRRRSTTRSEGGEYKLLTKREKYLCLLSMILPFILNVVKEISVSIDEEEDDETEDEKEERSTRGWLSKYMINMMKQHKYPIALLCMLYKMTRSVQQISYLFSLSRSYYPIHQLLGISYIRKKDLITSTSSTTSTTTRSESNHVVTVLIISAFCIKIIELLTNVETDSSLDNEKSRRMMLPEPPPINNKSGQLYLEAPLCPLCGQTRKNPSVSTGGYVFCYSCLSVYLSRFPYCPVTGVSCCVDDIIRLSD